MFFVEKMFLSEDTSSDQVNKEKKKQLLWGNITKIVNNNESTHKEQSSMKWKSGSSIHWNVQTKP